jgi:xylulokinase
VGSTEVSGVVSSSVAGELGLPAGVPVVGGGADNAAGAVGSGVVSVGLVQSSIGTSGTLLTPIDRAQVDRRMRLHTFCHSAPDLWYLMGVILSAGNSLRWLRDILLPSVPDGAYETLVSEAERVEPGSDGLFFQPYLTGERTPHNDAAARGVFFGLHLGHTRAHLVRAVMEGVCFAMRDSMDLMREMQGTLSEVRAVGGGSRGSLWRQLQADVYGLPVVTMGPGTGPSYGAAAMAAVGSTEFASIKETVSNWLHVDGTVEPEPGRAALYSELHGAHRELYPALKRRFADTAAMMDRLSS